MSIKEIMDGLNSRMSETGTVDYLDMIQSTSIIKEVASLVLGILVELILILVPIIASIEIVYICFPVIRDKADQLLDLDGRKVQGSGRAKTILQFTFRDAIEAVTIANTNMIGEQSALWIYFKLKMKSIMFLAFVVSFILSGSTQVVAFIHKLFVGVIEAIF